MTAEEKAREYAEAMYPYKNYKDEVIPLVHCQEFLREAAEDGFKAGYEEANRWRDPEEELPEAGVMVQMKVFNGHDNRLEYDHDRYLGNHKWDRNTSKYIEIIGWRPIE